jgi:excinuclease ABC subunit B
MASACRALDNRPLKFDEFERRMRQCVFVSATPADYEKTHAGQVVEQVVRPTGLVDPLVEVRPATHQVDDVLQEIRITVDKGERVLITTLTKRMAEQLTDYLTENGVKVRYLHSDVDTVERVEIIRDLRLGTFDVLVGINLLREGLDIPEVAGGHPGCRQGRLPARRAQPDPDHRPRRAQRERRAILYADRITESMKKAIGETERRRAKQMAYNEAHGIVPRGIRKQVREMIDGVVVDKSGQDDLRLAQQAAEVEALSEKDLSKRIKALEKQMLEHARNLEFEKAARVRDQLAQLREQAFGGGPVHDGNVVPFPAKV